MQDVERIILRERMVFFLQLSHQTLELAEGARPKSLLPFRLSNGGWVEEWIEEWLEEGLILLLHPAQDGIEEK